MTNEQLYLAVGVPLLFNGVIFIILVTSFNARFTALEASFNTRFASLEASVNARFEALEKRIDAQFEAAHQQLLRVEGVLDARLKHLEDARQ